MTIQQLREVHQARPFRPFALYVADGRRLEVTHNEFLSHSASGRTIVLHGADETFNIIDRLLVTSIEVRDGASVE